MKETPYLKDNQRILKLLRSLETFQQFSIDDIKKFLILAKLREYDPGEEIIREGDFDCWIYFLLQGSLNIIKGDKTVATLKTPGELFGEMGVIDGSARSATIAAAGKCLVLGIDGSLIERQLNADDLRFCYLVYRVFSEVLAARLRETTHECIRLKSSTNPN